MNSWNEIEAEFEKLLKSIRFVDKTSFEEIPGNIQLWLFLKETVDKAYLRGREDGFANGYKQGRFDVAIEAEDLPVKKEV